MDVSISTDGRTGTGYGGDMCFVLLLMLLWVAVGCVISHVELSGFSLDVIDAMF